MASNVRASVNALTALAAFQVDGSRHRLRAESSNDRLVPNLTGSIDCAQHCAHRIAGNASIS